MKGTPDPIGKLLSEVQPERVQWLWPGRIPRGKITILDGDPGLGKSLITLDLAARVTAGREMPDGARGLQGGVVLASGEDGLADTVRPRLEAAGADLTLIVDLTFTEPDQGKLLKLPDDLAQLKSAILRVGAVFVVIDPIYSFLSERINTDKDTHIRQALTLMAKLADEMQIAVVLVRHLNKAEEKKAIYRGGGSIGLIGLARSALLVAKARKSEGNVLASIKCNLAPPPTALLYRIESIPKEVPTIKWLGECAEIADDLTQPYRQKALNRTEEAESYIKGALSQGPLPSSVLEQKAKEHGISPKTYQRARRKAGVNSTQQRQGWLSSLEPR